LPDASDHGTFGLLMNYVTVFDAATEPFRNWWFPAFGLIFVAIGYLQLFKPSALPFGRQLSERRGRMSWYVLVFAILWTLIAAAAIGIGSYRAWRELKTGDYRVVEGRVENFEPMPWAGHGDESFDVNGVHFAYSDYVVTSGFNNAASHGGPIRAGLPVRIAYKDGQILRLEIAH
jgi:hypothetical protein